MLTTMWLSFAESFSNSCAGFLTSAIPIKYGSATYISTLHSTRVTGNLASYMDAGDLNSDLHVLSAYLVTEQ